MTEERYGSHDAESGCSGDPEVPCVDSPASPRGRRLVVTTDLPDTLPITESELDLLEICLSDLIAEMLKGTGTSR